MSEEFWAKIEGLASTREANVETWLVLPLLEALGHDRDLIDSQTPIVFQEGRERRPKRADFVVYAERPFGRANSLIVVETKRTDEPLTDGLAQGESYAQNLRAPILLMTNGQRLEVWQSQLTTESVCIFACNVAELAGRRGELESLLSKEAIEAHCEHIEYKNFDVLARDLGAYERAEVNRLRPITRFKIPRNLHNTASKTNMSWIELLTMQGAVVTGPSGYGKTVLAASLVQEGFERRLAGEADELPFDLFLPALNLDRQSIEAFLADRVAAHKPGFSASMLSKIAREQGLLLVADGYERVAYDRRDDIRTALQTVLRDFPKSKLVLLSRANAAPLDLNLPQLQLLGYTPEDLRDLAQVRATTHPHAAGAFLRAPAYVHRLGEIPLLADRLLDRFEQARKHTAGVATLYETWLGSMLAQWQPFDRALARSLIGTLARETSSGPIASLRALELAKDCSEPQRVLNRLAEADAIIIRDDTVELGHEALADYLRALQFWAISAELRAAELAALKFDPAAQFAMLLVDTAPNAEWRRQAWQAVAKADIRLAIRSLRFAGGDETFGASTADTEARRFLDDIRDAIETLLAAHLDPVADRLRDKIAGGPIERLAIEGTVDAEGVGYTFLEAKDASTPVILRQPDADRGRRMYGHALRRVGYGPEAGRILGVERIKGALCDLQKGRDLLGGPVWLEERVFGRLRHLAERYDYPLMSCSLQEAYDLLEQEAAKWVYRDNFSGGQQFSIRELLDDIAWLMAQGKARIDKWWVEPRELDLHSIEAQQDFARTLDEYYRRSQIAYAEVVEQSLPALRPHLDTLRMMPLRLQIEAEIHTRRGFEEVTLHYRRWPVETYGEAGADVSFPEKASTMKNARDGQEYLDQTDALLTRFGRFFPDRIVVSGWMRPPDFRGDDTSFDGLSDESCVVRRAMKWLQEDLDRLFSEMPTYSSL